MTSIWSKSEIISFNLELKLITADAIFQLQKFARPQRPFKKPKKKIKFQLSFLRVISIWSQSKIILFNSSFRDLMQMIKDDGNYIIFIDLQSILM